MWTAALIAAAFAGSAQAGQPLLTSVLDVDHSWYAQSGELSMNLSITNNSAKSVYVLEWQTPFAGIDADIFAVELDGEPVPYIGKLYKRSAPTPGDYVLLRAGETLTKVIDDLPMAYDMDAAGEYTVRYSVSVVQGAYELNVQTRGSSDVLLPGIESNDVFMWLERPPINGLARGDFGSADAKATEYTSCRRNQRTQLVTALDNAAMIADLAVDHLDGNPNGDDLYAWWFGTYTRSRFATVSDHFDAISDALNNKPMSFNCGCNSMAYAYVYANQPYEIYLCRAFWMAPDLGRDSKAGTIVHETSHFTVVAGTDDYVYGASGAHDLAMSSPDKAVGNADNHEYFAEDQVD